MNIHDVISELIAESKSALETAKSVPADDPNWARVFDSYMGKADAFNKAVELIMKSDAATKDLVVQRFMELAGPWAGTDVDDGTLAFGFNPPEGHYERDECPELYEFIARSQVEA